MTGTGVRRRVTWLLAASWAGLYVLALVLSGGARSGGSFWTWGSPRQGVLLALGAATRDLVEDGEVWRLLANAFLHASFVHVLFNTWVWLAVGRQLESLVGSARCWIVFGVAAVASGAAAVFVPDRPVLALGASGGVLGTVGALGVWSLRVRDPIARPIRRMVFVFLLFSLLLFLVPGASHEGHAAGLGAGAVAMIVLGPRRSVRPPGRATLVVAVLLGLAAAGTAVLVAERVRHRADAGDVQAFLRQVHETENLAERLYQHPRYAREEDRRELARLVDETLASSWIRGHSGEAALRAYLETFRAVARNDVPDPFAWEARRDRAKAAWKPIERRLRSEHGLVGPGLR